MLVEQVMNSVTSELKMNISMLKLPSYYVFIV